MFTLQFLNDKIHNYGFFDIIVNFIIQKLKSKHTFLKNIQAEQTNIFFSHFDETGGEKKTNISHLKHSPHLWQIWGFLFS